MDSFEKNIRGLVGNLKRYSMLEFFQEEVSLKTKIADLKNSLNTFNVYLPNTQLSVDDPQKAERDIKIDLRERITSFVTKIDHKFAMENYDYVMEHVKDDQVKEIYKQLGPFDHY